MKVIIKEPFEVTKHFETACNYEVSRVEPGTYEMKQKGFWCGKPYFYADIPATIVESFYQNRLFYSTSNHKNEDVGQPSWFSPGYVEGDYNYGSKSRFDGKLEIVS